MRARYCFQGSDVVLLHGRIVREFCQGFLFIPDHILNYGFPVERLYGLS